MTDLYLTIFCPVAHAEALFDTLLALPEVDVFSSAAVAVHGLSPALLDAREQVLGAAAMTEVRAVLALAGKDSVLSALRSRFSGSGMRYSVTPVLEAGVFA